MMNLLKLVKYDWKRNAGMLLVLGTLFLLAEAALTVYSKIKHLDIEFIYVLSFVFYVAVTVMVCVTTCRTYERNLRYFNRRLLPLPAVYTILSPMLLGLAGLVVIGAVGVLHLVAIGMMWDSGILRISDVLADRGFWSMLVASTMFMMIIFLCITVSKIFTGKKGIWIGVALFMALQFAFDWLEKLLFPDTAVTTDQFFESVNERITEGTDAVVHVRSTVPNFWGPLVFEIIAISVLVYATAYLINRRLQAKG
ncbi:hypothetical protein [Paenibacillus glycanilyticus]|uniref:ABC transporter permease n=1 Tax=Paenibacillus glycanilyticus TaxID=126569 RepID=A0ABQ6GGP8_9BACL|nr:hypothetical protein [Paenibacillus glycanilyticus]GLX68227.1 hypothetical protein MU1_25720 [Paenibacillus glycanilyticus]